MKACASSEPAKHPKGVRRKAIGPEMAASCRKEVFIFLSNLPVPKDKERMYFVNEKEPTHVLCTDCISVDGIHAHGLQRKICFGHTAGRYRRRCEHRNQKRLYSALDVNPSIELTVTDGLVTGALAYNDDGTAIVLSANVIGMTSDAAISAM